MELCFRKNTKQFKIKNLEQVPDSETTEMKEVIAGLMTLTLSSLNSSSSSIASINSGILLSICERVHWYGLDTGDFGDDPELWNSLTSSDLSNSLTLNSLSSSNSWSSSIKKSIHFHTGRSLSSLEKAFWGDSDSTQSDSSNSTISSDAEEEY